MGPCPSYGPACFSLQPPPIISKLPPTVSSMLFHATISVPGCRCWAGRRGRASRARRTRWRTPRSRAAPGPPRRLTAPPAPPGTAPPQPVPALDHCSGTPPHSAALLPKHTHSLLSTWRVCMCQQHDPLRSHCIGSGGVMCGSCGGVMGCEMVMQATRSNRARGAAQTLPATPVTRRSTLRRTSATRQPAPPRKPEAKQPTLPSKQETRRRVQPAQPAARRPARSKRQVAKQTILPSRRATRPPLQSTRGAARWVGGILSGSLEGLVHSQIILISHISTCTPQCHSACCCPLSCILLYRPSRLLESII